MKQEGNTGQAPGSTMRFVKPASWMKLLLSNLASLSRIRTICINLLPTNSMVLNPIIQSPVGFPSCSLLVATAFEILGKLNVPSSHHLTCAQWCPTKSRDHGQTVQPAARKLPSLWNRKYLDNCSTLMKTHLKFILCCDCLSKHFRSLWGMSWYNDQWHTFLIAWWQSCEEKPRCFRSPPVTSFGKLSENLRVIQSILNIKSFLLCLPSTCHSQLVCQPYKMKLLCKQAGSYVQSY